MAIRSIGIIGGGQLARMMALAGYPLGLKFLVLDPNPNACAGDVAELLTADYDDPQALDELAGRVDVVTFDFENVPAAALDSLASKVRVAPGPKALAYSQDRLHEKNLFRELGIRTPEYRAVGSLEELQKAVAEIGLPCVLKTRRLGYDGKGQYRLRQPADIERAWHAIDSDELILEAFVNFGRELSVIAAKGRQDEDIRFYPLTQNTHKKGILISSLAPAPIADTTVVAEAQTMARQLLEALDYQGVLALELFELEDGSLLANEFAPRVHNSGHWTLNGSDTSQFENHLRAVAGMPLGSTRAIGYSAMINWIGHVPDPEPALACDGAHWHDYGKSSRPGRKVGHLNLRADDPESLRKMMARFATGLADSLG